MKLDLFLLVCNIVCLLFYCQLFSISSSLKQLKKGAEDLERETSNLASRLEIVSTKIKEKKQLNK